MAPLDRNFVTRVTLIGVLIGIFTTDSTNACNDDFTTCRYDCSDKVVQEHCTSENEVHCAVDGKCCPGYFRTKNCCQKCSDVMFMPDVNNCCECLPCAECEATNNTIATPCSHTSDTVCTIPDDPPSNAPTDCPWIESTSTPTTQVPTTQAPTTHGPTTDTKEVTVNTPSDPLRSKSERIYEGGFYTFMVLFILLFGFVVLICCYLCYAHHSAVPSPPATTAPTNTTVPPQGGTDHPDGRDKTWKGVAGIVAEQICRSCAKCCGQSANQTGTSHQLATATGGQSAPVMGGQSTTSMGGQSARPNNMGHDETDERGNQKTDKNSRTVVYTCQQVIGEGNAAPPGDQSGDEVQEREDANLNDSGRVREPGERVHLLSGVVPP